MRFDYVKYDAKSVQLQDEAKRLAQDLEHFITVNLGQGRAVSLALTNLEETYMWIGKAIRDAQIARTGTAELQEQRKDG